MNTIDNNTAEKIAKRIAVLDTIAEMIKPLDPPVNSFEKSIRRTPYRILLSVLLSSRTKDAVTHQASEKLFSVAETPEETARLSEDRIAELIYPVGFYRQKARHIKAIAVTLANSDLEPGSIPQTYGELTSLPGVGRKTANLVIALAFGTPSIAVDIHVFRISQRLGWAKGKTPEEIEEQLKKAFPSGHWNRINQTLVGFGQTLCKPTSPDCHRCEITDMCLYFKETGRPDASGSA
jgi:endonuclease III